jgi:dihydroorotate dehydrogenase (fumarate)
MDLSTTYMGLKLKHPVVPSASPLSKDLESVKKLEDAGASAVVLYSIFEEQISFDAKELDHFLTHATESFVEAMSYFPQEEEYNLGPDAYLEHIRKCKDAVDIPIIASLNGVSMGGWIDYSKKMEEAGADGLELNVYYIPTDPKLESKEVEALYVDVLKAVKSNVKIPVAVKLSPFFSAMANFTQKLDAAGADALVMFNRFYQPDIDLDELEIVPKILFSTPHEMRLPMRWIAILYGKIKADMAATSGIYNGHDAVKLIMAGANVTNVCSTLLDHGPDWIGTMVKDMKAWMTEKEYESVAQMTGIMSQKSCPEPAAFERANYMKALTNFK